MATSEQNLERYLRGEPLTEELAQLRDGILPDSALLPETFTGQFEQNQSTEGKKGRISRADRVALKEMVAHPGWLVLHRLLENATLMHQEKAILLSRADPLANAEPIAQAWAYVNLYARAALEIAETVSGEIKKLEKEKPDETQPAVKGTRAGRTARKSGSARSGKNEDHG